VLGSATMYCHVPVAGWCMLSMVAGSDMVLITSLQGGVLDVVFSFGE
jgi:hypothetical protein